ncbi:hypothetical protein [Nocardia sp. NPDC050710]|uniref:hypothetical protein n=1 Tax=Nocardia sp. NPDC050710 TaxID=3157220 RepID=UPI0033F7D0EA
MELISLGIAVAATLTSRNGQGSSEGTRDAVERLREVITSRFDTDPETGASVAVSGADPTGKGWGVLAERITTEARADPDFADEIRGLVAVIRRDRAMKGFLAQAFDNARQVNIGGDNLGTIFVQPAVIDDAYGRAIAQIGSENTALRLAGFYALESIGQDNQSRRQTTVDVLCAYLRRPLEADSHEREVRQDVQRILTKHLRPDTLPAGSRSLFWAGMEVNLTRAQLHNLDASGCSFGSVLFSQASFHGRTTFGAARFDGNAEFGGAWFEGYTTFDGTTFTGHAFFVDTVFQDVAWFADAVFNAEAHFTQAVFHRAAGFNQVGFHSWALFGWSSFGDTASFDLAQFGAMPAVFAATFRGHALFRETRFGASTTFLGARFMHTAFFDKAVFAGDFFVTSALFGQSSMGSVTFEHGLFVAIHNGEIEPGTVLEIADGRVIVDWQAVVHWIAPDSEDDSRVFSAAGLVLEGPGGVRIPFVAPPRQQSATVSASTPNGPFETEYDEKVHFARTAVAEALRADGRLSRFRPGSFQADQILDYRQLQDSVWTHRNAGDFFDAVNVLTALISIAPGVPEWLVLRGEILADIGCPALALPDLDSAIAMGLSEPARSVALSARGYARGLLGRYDEAMADFDICLRTNPSDAWTYFRRALLLAHLGGDPENDLRAALGPTKPALDQLQAAKARSMCHTDKPPPPASIS